MTTLDEVLARNGLDDNVVERARFRITPYRGTHIRRVLEAVAECLEPEHKHTSLSSHDGLNDARAILAAVLR